MHVLFICLLPLLQGIGRVCPSGHLFNVQFYLFTVYHKLAMRLAVPTRLVVEILVGVYPRVGLYMLLPYLPREAHNTAVAMRAFSLLLRMDKLQSRLFIGYAFSICEVTGRCLRCYSRTHSFHLTFSSLVFMITSSVVWQHVFTTFTPVFCCTVHI